MQTFIAHKDDIVVSMVCKGHIHMQPSVVFYIKIDALLLQIYIDMGSIVWVEWIVAKAFFLKIF